MQINLVSYLNPFQHNGGGEMVNRRLIEVGKDRGHNFNYVFAKKKTNDYNDDADFDLLIDVFNYPETLRSRGAWIHLPANLLEHISKSRKFVHMTNAYADICNLGYIPCSGNSKSKCAHKNIKNVVRNIAAKDFSSSCFAQNNLVKNLFLKSSLNVYVSPLHRDITNRVLNIKEDKSLILKPIIDVDKFTINSDARDIDYLFVGVLSEAKGYYAIREQYFNKDIVFIGDVHPNIKLDFGTYVGKVPYSEVPKYMSRAKNFVFLPRWPEPQGRVVVEAALSGCNLIINENVGAASFDFELANGENFKNSSEEFWDELERRIS